jgi:hypothetical protein
MKEIIFDDKDNRDAYLNICHYLINILAYEDFDINYADYYEHLFRALTFSIKSIGASFIFIFHGIFPNCCIHTGSNLIRNLQKELDDTNHKKSYFFIK